MIDLRSDTVTRPTAQMREAMSKAPVGDDVYGDDPTVNELEALAARVTGKEAALFVCSGTMGNQLAVMTHTRPGEEIIMARSCHIFQHEAGGHARLSGVSAALVEHSPLRPEDVSANFRSEDIHHPRTSLVCLENALGDGRVVGVEDTAATARRAHELGLLVHLDGARLFNAAAALNTDARELVREVDSVMFCLSKGLCAPVGSMLCGSRDFISRARRNRKILGGGLRQAGVLAACGLLAIREMTGRLKEDHRHAKELANLLSGLPHLLIDPARVDINMVFFGIDKPGFEDAAFVDYMKENGVLINGVMDGEYRFVTHNDTDMAGLERAAGLVRDYLKR